MNICALRLHCVACRTRPGFRQMLVNDGQAAQRDFDCPYGLTAETILDKPSSLKAIAPGELAAQGRAAWAALSTAAVAGTITNEWLKGTFRSMVPRVGCTCLKDYDDLLETIPFRAADQFAWQVDFHNAINAKLAAGGDATKRQWTVAEARAALAPTAGV